ncbi:hypothetical protein Syun_016825 [Stephania yunnanensis]|uniref:ATPase AAA-type core domain-containing protein n=1 Tax=Stephania yunnanensis TaxID=152371 RepID=A0AAP0J822_9MAGN
MAAIKRSQANQRRHPDAFHFYHHHHQLPPPPPPPPQQPSSSSATSPSSSISCVKVELQQLILSILDDPVVSRVFGEAGFRSCDVKLAIVRPPPLMRLQRPRRPPMFLCNFDETEGVFMRRSFSFPFAAAAVSGTGGDIGGENCRRIGEIMCRKKERNPLLVGGLAGEAVRGFAAALETGVLPGRIDEVDRMVESCGVVVSFGDLKVLLVGSNGGGGGGAAAAAAAAVAVMDRMSFVVSQLTKLLERNRAKLWLIGATANYEAYLKFLNSFPSIEKDWDLQLLPITGSVRSPSSVNGGFPSRPPSLMESFVPFGGFFSSPSDFKEPFSSSPYQSLSRCRACNEKYEQEVSTILSGGCSRSVADQYQENVPSWLQMAEVNANIDLNIAKAKDDGTVLNAKIAGLQRKWIDICRRLNHRPSVSVSEAGSYQVRSPMFHSTTGFPFVVKVDTHISSSVNETVKGTACENVFPIMSTGLQKFPLMEKEIPKPVVSEARSDNSASELEGRRSKSEGLQLQSYQLPECSTSRLSNPSRDMSPSSPVSVATDLGLGTIYAPSSTEELNKPSFQGHKERLMDISGCLPSKVDALNSNILNPSIRSSSGCSPDLSSQVELKDFKALYRCLVEKVGRQNEAIHVICQTIARCRTGNDERRRRPSTRQDIWFSFVGPDRIAKKKIAAALAEIIFGSRHNLICVDLSPQNGSTHSNTILDCHEISGYDVKHRGKTVVDIIADEIIKKPPSVVFLENIDKADLLAQRSLSQAIITGKFQDTRGREISINNSIFLTTAGVLKDNKESTSFEKDLAKFKEERISEARRLEMQILIDCIPEVKSIGDPTSKVRVTSRKGSFELNKRKRSGIGDLEGHDEKLEFMKPPPKTSKCLDLNLPIEEMEQECSDSKSSDSECISENSKLWLEDLIDQMDGTLLFKPFDFDTLANNILKEISSILISTVCSEVLLEIDYEVMEQLLAAAWISNGICAIKDWLEHILGGCLTEAQKRCSLNSSRTLLKLQNCEGMYVKDLALGVCLPARIPLN